MIQPFVVKMHKNFLGREHELRRLEKVALSKEASIIVMYGRRRVGKTELLEQSFRDRNIVKFEGIEGLTEKEQLVRAMKQLAQYTGDVYLSKVSIDSWREFFQLLVKYTSQGVWTIYLEELQWLANFESKLIAELKYVWDNYFRYNDNLILILCGSAPSFMLDHVVHSKALYNRSQYEFHLREFNLPEMELFLKDRGNKEVLDA